MKQLLSTLLLSCSLTCIGAQEINIIPKPIQITQAEGKFVLTPQTLITYDKELELQASYLQEIFGGSTGWDLQMEEGNAQTGAIHLSLNPEMRQAEGYELEVTPSGVQISGADPGGAVESGGRANERMAHVDGLNAVVGGKKGSELGSRAAVGKIVDEATR